MRYKLPLLIKELWEHSQNLSSKILGKGKHCEQGFIKIAESACLYYFFSMLYPNTELQTT